MEGGGLEVSEPLQMGSTEVNPDGLEYSEPASEAAVDSFNQGEPAGRRCARGSRAESTDGVS